ncbi:MAG TPA: hypothetical protein VMF89_20830 [Polyangiales bacterium]|nr:hypothetical protein [Polyangiales bacterium]
MQTSSQDLTSRLRSGSVLAALFISVFSLGALACNQTTTVGCDEGADGGANACVCEYNGKGYPAGATFKDAEDCNDCGCQEDGTVVCTLMLCVDTCGGLNDPGCPDGQYCDFPVEAICGAADGTGICKEPSEVCEDIYQPVCGCDDKTYGNACEASGAGVSVASEGPCGGCFYNGELYEYGDSFPDADGCNQCSCTEGGLVACTLRACAPEQP